MKQTPLKVQGYTIHRETGRLQPGKEASPLPPRRTGPELDSKEGLVADWESPFGLEIHPLTKPGVAINPVNRLPGTNQRCEILTHGSSVSES